MRRWDDGGVNVVGSVPDSGTAVGATMMHPRLFGLTAIQVTALMASITPEPALK